MACSIAETHPDGGALVRELADLTALAHDGVYCHSRFIDVRHGLAAEVGANRAGPDQRPDAEGAELRRSASDRDSTAYLLEL
jgi:hypothetical protein